MTTKPKKKTDWDLAKKSENFNDQSKWLVKYWRPAMAWSYMAICLFDFIFAPVGTAVLITFYKSTIPVWKSLTLENGGIIHIAFGAILGVSAWGRTKETVIGSQYGGRFGNGYSDYYYSRDDMYIEQRRKPPNRNDNRSVQYQDELIDNMHDSYEDNRQNRRTINKNNNNG